MLFDDGDEDLDDSGEAEDVYVEEGRDHELENDEIEGREYGFMRGYEESQNTKLVRNFEIQTLDVTSPAFKEGEMIPAKYTCEGKNISPEINVERIPKEAVCLAVMMEDLNTKPLFTHWIAWNLLTDPKIIEDTVDGLQGDNSYDEEGYRGPCPPKGETHRYQLSVYALNANLDLDRETEISIVKSEIKEHIVAYGSITGEYRRKQ